MAERKPKFTKRIENEIAYLKANLYGPPGSGKTYTALTWATGLVKMEQAKGNKGARILMLDTEHGSDHYSSMFQFFGPQQGSRSVRDVLDLVADAELPECAGSVVVIDSISHIWEQCPLDYAKAHNMGENRLELSDWGGVKKPYKDMMYRLIAGAFHCIICGRQSNQTEDMFDFRKQKNVKVFIGFKQAAEKDTLHESHLVARMELGSEENEGVKDPRQMRKALDPNKIVHRLIVEKDRSNQLQGQTITNPDFEDILPVLNRAGATQGGFETSEDAAVRGATLHKEREWTLEDAQIEMEKCKTLATMHKLWEREKATWQRQLGEVGFKRIMEKKDFLKSAMTAEEKTPPSAA